MWGVREKHPDSSVRKAGFRVRVVYASSVWWCEEGKKVTVRVRVRV